MIQEYINKYKEEIKKSIKDLKNLKTCYRQIPNLLTFLRLVGGLPAGLMYYFGNPYVALGLIAFLWGTDAIDGKLARKYNIQSKLGADMDALADKIMFLASSLPLIGMAPGLVVNFILEGVIAVINVTGRIKGLDTKTVFSGKVKTVSLAITLVFGYLSQFFGASISILKSLILATIGLQLISIKDYVSEYKKMERELEEKTSLGNANKVISLDKVNNLDNSLSLNVKKIDELRYMKEFVLGSVEPGRIYTGKKRVRIMMKEKNNNYFE